MILLYQKKKKMLTSNIENDFFNESILLGKTIDSIAVSQEDNDVKYISVYFTDCSCIELVLNNSNDFFYMEPII